MHRYHKELPLASLIRKSVPLEEEPQPLLTPQQVAKLRTFGDILLQVIAVAGLITVAAVAPKALMALQIFQKSRSTRPMKQKQQLQKVTRAFYYLKENGRLMIERKGDDYLVRLTRKGRAQLRKLHIVTVTVPRPAKWDGYYWQVAADIPTEDYKNAADLFRMKLREMKFYPLQRTLWFYPFDPRVEIEFVARTYGIFSFVTVMKIAELDPAEERPMRRHFRKEGILI